MWWREPPVAVPALIAIAWLVYVIYRHGLVG